MLGFVAGSWDEEPVGDQSHPRAVMPQHVGLRAASRLRLSSGLWPQQLLSLHILWRPSRGHYEEAPGPGSGQAQRRRRVPARTLTSQPVPWLQEKQRVQHAKGWEKYVRMILFIFTICTPTDRVKGWANALWAETAVFCLHLSYRDSLRVGIT